MEFEGHNILKPSKLMPQKSPLLLGIKQSNSWHYKPFSNTESITQGFYKVSCPRVKLLKLVIKTHYYVENLDFWTSSSKSADKIVMIEHRVLYQNWNSWPMGSGFVRPGWSFFRKFYLHQEMKKSKCLLNYIISRSPLTKYEIHDPQTFAVLIGWNQ